ncbi:YrrS family protein [Allobacillus sp. GCM10007491]|uniref:YrrS family protein n=1 Tax=Allobacillus saliphilus TaxID=2912308 RepID=A0A941CTE7_9BACI|nr:YrrS family protein [Allobacillus saliphilus]MBR7553369.1 YrrS family protein [Allobacillus saliphilus]
MADEYQNEHTRAERFEKRRRTTKMLNYMLILAGILILLLAMLFFFSGEDEAENADSEEGMELNESSDGESNETGSSDQEEDNENTDEGNEDQTSDEDQSTDEQEQSDEEETEESSEEDSGEYSSFGENIEVEQSNEENVIKVIKGNWDAYPTNQNEPHSIDLNKGSQDRQELEEASAMAINGDSENITYWWFGSDGRPNYVEATIENQTDGEIYRVHLEWIENKGWQPQLVKVLEENDQKHRFE